jgi:hypothetical protein
MTLESTVIGEFETRREAELAVEHIVQEYGVQRTDVFIQPVGQRNSAGTRSAGADAKASPEPDGQAPLEGALEVSVDFHGGDTQKIAAALTSAGAKSVRTA